MRVLAIDTSLGACSAAVMADGELLAHAFEVLGRGHAERLVPMAGDVMAAAGTAFADLDLIAVTVGPGTFTGVRIGLAAARGFALAHGLPLCGVTSTEAVAEAVYAESGNAGLPARLAVIHDARRGEVYLELFKRSDGAEAPVRSLGEPEVVARADVPVRLAGELMAVAGTAVALVGAAITAENPRAILLDKPCYPDARIVARIALRRGPARQPVRPLYLRAPDAKLPQAS